MKPNNKICCRCTYYKFTRENGFLELAKVIGVASVIFEIEIMWHSEADILKDLISLDDFGVSGKDESYKFLYSFGRGIKTQQKPKLTNAFIDPRSGETINLDEEISEPSNTCCISKGRGSVLGSFTRTKCQLQKQLRLARPLGSSDHAIESYCRRNRPARRHENSSSTDSESNTIKSETPVDISHSPFNSLIDNMRQKVKATRNSKLQHNALISSLLSRGTNTSGSSSIMEKSNFLNEDDDDDDDDDDKDKIDSSMTSCCSSFDTGSSSNKTLESEIERDDPYVPVQVDGVSTEEKVEQAKGFGFVDDSDKLLKKCQIDYQLKLSPRIIANFTNLDKKTGNSSEMYKRLGERYNSPHHMKRNQIGIYDFGECLKNLTSSTAGTFDAAEHFFGSTSGDFSVNKDDFPPLRRSSLK